MSIEKQKYHVDTLLSLIKENPELRIIPKVDSEIVADEGFSWWVGGWGDAEIDYMTKGIDSEFLYEEKVYFDDDRDEIEQELSDKLYSQGVSDGSNFELMLEREMEHIKWEKVITVRITLPE